MIVKEYRVTMPLSVEEYQVAQLYMVAKLSTQQTGVFFRTSARLSTRIYATFSLLHFAGGGEGVTVLMNEPFAGHPELGAGQANEPSFFIPLSHFLTPPHLFSSASHSTQKRFIT